MLHLPAIAHELGKKLDLEYIDKISRNTPQLCKLNPAGAVYMEDLYDVGGISALLKDLYDNGLIHGETIGVTNRPLKEVLSNSKGADGNVIREFNNPWRNEGGLAILRGNLCPDGAVVKQGAVLEHMLTHTGPARIYESEEAAAQGILRVKCKREKLSLSAMKGQRAAPGCKKC